MQKYYLAMAIQHSGYLVRLDGEFPDEVQALAVMLAGSLTDKAVRERSGQLAVGLLYDLLATNKRQRDVKFKPADFPPLLEAVRAADNEQSKPLAELLEKMARDAK